MENILYKLSKSKFRNSFHLNKKDISYIDEKGLDKILIKDSTVLIKASHSMAFEKIAAKLQGVK